LAGGDVVGARNSFGTEVAFVEVVLNVLLHPSDERGGRRGGGVAGERVGAVEREDYGADGVGEVLLVGTDRPGLEA
jgi:hypothetical protein